MKKAWRVLCLLLTAILFLMMCGCWDYTDVEDLAVGMGFAVDKTENGNYLMTVEIANPGMGSGEGNTIQSLRVEAEGETLFDCMRNMAKKLDHKVYYPHAQVMIISEEVAREGIQRVLDIIARSLQLRLTLFIAVSKDKTAKELFETRTLMNQIQSFSIASKLLNNRLTLSKAPSLYAYEAIDDACTRGMCLSLPALQIANEGGKPTIELAGTAVFHNEKLVGFLDDDESKAFLFAVNRIKGGLLIVQIDTPTLKRPDVTLEILKSTTTVKPVLINNQLTMDIKIETDVMMTENQAGVDFSNAFSENKLKQEAQRELENDIKHVIKRMQTQCNADIFGFGRDVNDDMPQVWKKIEPFWFEWYYKTLPVNVTAKINIKSGGLLQRPLKAGD